MEALKLFTLSLSAIAYLWGSPFNRNLPSVGDVVAIVFQISRHTKISNLQSILYCLWSGVIDITTKNLNHHNNIIIMAYGEALYC